MNRKIGRELPDQTADAGILHDHRVHAGRHHRPQMPFRLGEFVFENQRVQRDVTAHAAPVEKGHQFRQVSGGEIVRPHPGIELFQPEIDGIRAVLDRRPGAIPIAGRRKQFR